MRRRLIKLWPLAATSLVALIGAGCGTLTIPPYAEGPGKGARTQESEGLKISAEAFVDNDQTDKYFKVNPKGRRIGIVDLHAENRSPDATWLLTEENIRVMCAGMAPTNAHDQEVKGDYSGANAMGSAGAVMILVCLPASLPMLFSANKMGSDAAVIQKNFVDKEWRNQTLSPGQSAQGFIYFNLPKEVEWGKSGSLQIDCLNTRNQKTNTLTIPLTYETK